MFSNTNIKSRISLVLLALLIIQLISSVLGLFIDVPIQIDQYVLILMPVLIVAIFMKVNMRERFKLNGFKWSSLGYIIALVILIAPVSMFISQLTEIIFGENPLGIDAHVDSLNFGFPMLLFYLAITPAICEELMFRGLLMDTKSGLNMHKLALLNGLMFGLFHVGFDQVFYCIWMGTLLGYVTIITRSIFPAMIIHFLNNAIAVFEIWIDNQNMSMPSVMVSPLSATSTFILGMIAVIAFVIIIFIIKRLIVIYNYDDQERMLQNEADSAIYASTNKFKVYWPLALITVYVIFMNMITPYLTSIEGL